MQQQQQTGTWKDLIPTLVTVATRAPQKEARDFAMGELLKLGEIVDRHIAQLEALRSEGTPIRHIGERGVMCPDCGIAGAHAYGCPLGPQPDAA